MGKIMRAHNRIIQRSLIMSMRIHSTHIRVHAAVRAWRTFQFNVYFSDTSRSRNSPLIDESIWLMRTVICHQRCNTTVVRVNVVAYVERIYSKSSHVFVVIFKVRRPRLLGLQIKRLYACTVSRMFPHFVFFQYNSKNQQQQISLIFSVCMNPEKISHWQNIGLWA